MSKSSKQRSGSRAKAERDAFKKNNPVLAAMIRQLAAEKKLASE